MHDLLEDSKGRPLGTQMTAEYAVEFVTAVTKLGIDLWVDGGWAVDALLGEQTRAHADLDIVIQQRDLPELRAWLEARGFYEVERDYSTAWNFVLGDGRGHEIDVHLIVLDEEGNGIYGPPERGVMYPAAALTGTGFIGGLPLKCISPEWLVTFHTGYEPLDTDDHDVAALCRRFGIDVPDDYAHLRERS